MLPDLLDRPLISPQLIGREAHLETLRRYLDEVRGGQERRAVFISGDAGIGKSRLVGEAAAVAAAQGFRMLAGQCFEPDRALPYAPIRDLIRSSLRRPDFRDAITDAAGELGALVPELSPGEPAPEDARDRQRIVAAFAQLLRRLGAPVLLVVEDAHWSDEASVQLVLDLARLLRHEPALPAGLIVTYRGDEVTIELGAALAAFDRERLAAELRLGPLPRPETMAMLRAMHGPGGPERAELFEAIYRLSEGNPFFVEELLRSALAGGTGRPSSRAGERDAPIPLPRSVAESVRRRVEHLSDGARATLTLAAVTGRRFDFALLAVLADCPDDVLVERIKELVAARLIIEEEPDRFAFRHALMREAIDGALLARERRELHRRVLETILRTDPGAPANRAADLTRHAVGAEAWEEALEFGQRAGAQALALHAPHAAIDHLSHARYAAAQLGVAPPASLLLSRGRAYETVGAFEAAQADYEAAIALARETGNASEEAEASLALGGLWASRDYEQTGTFVRRALELARSSRDAVLTARALNRLGNWHANQDEPREAMRLHEEALSLMEASGDRRGIAETLDLIGMARYLTGDRIGAAEALRRVIPLLRELDDRRTLASALITLTFSMNVFDSLAGLVAPGSYEERLAQITEAITIARETGARSDEALADAGAALVLAERQFDIALGHGSRAQHLAEEIGHRQWAILAHFVQGVLCQFALDPEAARTHFEHAAATAREIGSSFWLRETLTYLTMLNIETGDFEVAEAALVQVWDERTPMQSLDQREAWLARAELELARSRPEPALALVDRLIAATGIDAGDHARVPGLALARGRVLAALGRHDDALASFAAARDGAITLGNPPLRWRAHLARYAVLRSLGRRAGATSELAAAHETAAVYADGIADDAIRESFLRRVTERFPPLPRPSPRQAATAAFGGLTRRERDVAALIAAGHTNREIGEALFMSERTAATHVGNILGKLGLKTRAQVAAWAQEHGLTASGDGQADRRTGGQTP